MSRFLGMFESIGQPEMKLEGGEVAPGSGDVFRAHTFGFGEHVHAFP